MEDIPLKWWTKEIFQEIGDRYGGLLDINHRTDSMQQLFSAKIKVRGIESGFIPAEMDMGIGDDKFTIKLKIVSKLSLNRRKMKNSPVNLDNFDRYTIDLATEDEQSEVVETGNREQDSPRGSGGEDGILAARKEREANEVEKGDWVAMKERKYSCGKYGRSSRKQE